jgi:hypothetical protein
MGVRLGGMQRKREFDIRESSGGIDDGDKREIRLDEAMKGKTSTRSSTRLDPT